jgi:glycosyltransferase involved in cell wall biosynthesis
MKKVLIVTYYFPPAGGPGVQRWLKFVKYLPDFGIQPIVYIPENPSYPIIDNALTQEVSNRVIVLKKKIIEPYGLASFISKSKTKKISSGIIPSSNKQSAFERILLWIRGNLFIPDARVLWVKPSVNYLKKYIIENQIDTIITTGPPHSLHLIGLNLKQQLPIRWMADFRDPWITIGYHHQLRLTASSMKKHEALESEVLQTADEILVTSKTTRLEFLKNTVKPIHVITNGFDTEDVPNQHLDKSFSLAHIGSLLSERNPLILWQCLAELVKEIPEFGKHLELKLIGTVSDDVMQTINSYDLERFVNLVGYVSHQEALIQQRKSQTLLLIEINSKNTISIIPGKLFEYMASGRPILAIGPLGSDFSEIITQTNTGLFFDYSQKVTLKESIIKNYHAFLAGKLEVHGIGIDNYSRKKLTEQLSSIILKSRIENLNS